MAEGRAPQALVRLAVRAEIEASCSGIRSTFVSRKRIAVNATCETESSHSLPLEVAAATQATEQTLRNQMMTARIRDRRHQRSNPMRLEVKRLDRDGRYETLVERDDGVSFHVLGVAHKFGIPHDLAHYVIEKALRIKGGFWGSVAAGAVFPSMTYLAGRRRPKAAERSSALLKAHARALVEAEVTVRIFNDTIEEGYRENSPVLAARLNDRLPLAEQKLCPISPRDITEVYSAYKAVLRDWEALPVGVILIRHW